MSTKARRTATRPASKSVVKNKRHATKHAPAAAKSPAVELSKQDLLIEKLRSPDGGTMQQLIDLTGWQSHTVRGTVSGVLRKRLKLNVVCAPAAGSRVYRIIEARA